MRTSIILWLTLLVVGICLTLALAADVKGLPVFPSSWAKYTDRGPVTRSIIVVFAVSLALNAANTARIYKELKCVERGLKSNPNASKLRLMGRGVLGQHVDKMYQIYGDSFEGDISQAIPLSHTRNCLFGHEWLVRIGGQVLITLGLAGTIVGLADSLSGLGKTIQAINGDHAVEPTSPDGADSRVNQGLQAAVGGMASAFATTLYGALLGGILLKLLSATTEYLADHVTGQIELLTETQVVPLLRASAGDLAKRRHELLSYLDKAIEKENARLEAAVHRIDQITESFHRLAAATATLPQSSSAFSAMRKSQAPQEPPYESAFHFRPSLGSSNVRMILLGLGALIVVVILLLY